MCECVCSMLTLNKSRWSLEHSTTILCAFFDALSLHFVKTGERTRQSFPQHTWSINLVREEIRQGRKGEGEGWRNEECGEGDGVRERKKGKRKKGGMKGGRGEEGDGGK